MKPRLNPFAAAPAAMQAWLNYGKSLLACGLEDSLMELVKIRASQINGGAHCLDMQPAPNPAAAWMRAIATTHRTARQRHRKFRLLRRREAAYVRWA